MDRKMIYSDDQADALDNFTQFLQSTEQYMSVVGPAGSGKSTIVKQMLQIAEDDVFSRPILLTAPTHKATANLREITGQDAITIHKAMAAQIKRDWDTGEEYLAMNPRLIDKKSFHGTLVVIDEASMVGVQLMGGIKKLCKAVDCKVLFIGDSYQLNPVGEKKSVVVDVGKCPWRISELTTVHRQAADNPVLALATDIRLGNGSLTQWEQKLNDGVGVHIMSGNEWREHLIEHCKDIKSGNRAVTYTNAVTDRINKTVRKVAHGDKEDLPPYLPGETMVSNTRIAEGDKALVDNNEEVLIEKVDKQGDRYGITTECQREFEVMEDFDARKRYLNGLANKVKAGDSNWKEYYETADRIGDLRPVYSGTTHKSQGSTYGDVYLNLKELAGCRNPDEHRRLLYVALTRASGSVYATQ